MAENADGQEKTEEASPKKLLEARQRGQVAKSIDATTAVLLLIGVLIVYLFSSSMMGEVRQFWKMMFLNSSFIHLSDTTVPDYFTRLTSMLGFILLPMLATIFIVVLLAEISQVGLKFASKKFTEGLDFQRVFNVFRGMKNTFFSSRTIVEFVKGVFKIVIIGSVVYIVLASRMEDILSVMSLPFAKIGPFMVELGFELVMKVGLAYIAIAIGDLLYQKWKFREDQKMTKQEVKEEGKQMEGDLKAKARMRQIGRNRLQKIMLQRVKEADVVITNPTHYAVALKYDQAEMDSPKVVAKGVDFLALKIRDLAREHNVPIVEDPPLARSLHSLVEIDQHIPESLFKAVAQVLAVVFKARRRKQ